MTALLDKRLILIIFSLKNEYASCLGHSDPLSQGDWIQRGCFNVSAALAKGYARSEYRVSLKTSSIIQVTNVPVIAEIIKNATYR